MRRRENCKKAKMKIEDKDQLMIKQFDNLSNIGNFASEIESFQRASSLRGPRPLAIMIKHIGSKKSVPMPLMLQSCLHCVHLSALPL